MSVIWILSDRRYFEQRMPGALLETLAERGLAVRRLVADDRVWTVGGPDPWDGLTAGDLVVARTRDPFGLALLQQAERPGVTVVTPRSSVDAVRDKWKLAAALSEAEIPAPPTFLASRPELLRAVPRDRFPLLLKPNLGNNAAGILTVALPEDLSGVAWDGDVVVAQSFVDAGGRDVKIYGIGDDVWCVERPSPLGAPASVVSRPLPVTPELLDLARRCRHVFGLDLYGIDVVVSDAGPLVVDVNEFPNYTGVTEAPARLLALVLGRLGGSPTGEAAA